MLLLPFTCPVTIQARFGLTTKYQVRDLSGPPLYEGGPLHNLACRSFITSNKKNSQL
jgi:hypothetical protein